VLEPVASVSPADLAAGQRALVRDLAWASMSGAFSGGVILVAFALALGAKPLHVGLLAAIPFMAQAAQLPATILVERVRQRRKIGVMTISAARLVVFAMAALPFLPGQDSALMALIVAQLLIAGLNAVGGCAVNSWLHQLIPHRSWATSSPAGCSRARRWPAWARWPPAGWWTTARPATRCTPMRWRSASRASPASSVRSTWAARPSRRCTTRARRAACASG
jgi:hypothetical protein